MAIDLAHQSGYCLSGSYESCHVYKQPGGAAPPTASQPEPVEPALPEVALSSLDDLPSRRPRLESLNLRLLSLRLSLLLFRLRLRARMPEFSGLAKDLPAVGKNTPSFDQIRASLKSRLPQGKVNTRSPRQLDLRLFAIPAMLLLILLAAIIWWPPPGETEQDAIAVGAPISQELAGLDVEGLEPAGQEEIQPAGNAATRDEPLVPGVKTVSGATGLSAQTAVEAQDESTGSIESAEVILAESSSPDEFAQPAQSAVVEDETALVLEQDQAETAAVTQVEAGSVGVVSDAPALDAAAQAEASAEIAGSDILPVAAIASIGPPGGIQNPGEIYESREPLLLHAAPDNGADVVAQITSEQPATILGRDNSGEWILVRLNGNFEGWVNAARSGIGIPVDILPAIADLSAGADSSAVGRDLETPVPDLLPAAITGVVNIGALNVRAGPGVEYESIGVVYNKDEVSLLAQPESNGWVQVRLANDLIGWLNSNYLILPG